MKTRDLTIDRLRGFAIIWVLFVHLLYWTPYFNNSSIQIAKSFCLFEMPLFFLITGLSNGYSNCNNYLQFVFRRYQRILIPYWIYALICIVICSTKYITLGIFSLSLFLKLMISWLIPINSQMCPYSYLTWALWYIPVYLITVLFIPLLKHLSQSRQSLLYSGVILLLLFVSEMMKFRIGQYISFYSFWIYIGLLIHQKHRLISSNNFLKAIILLSLISLFLLNITGYSLDMQVNKFPPNTVFLLYSVFILSVLYLYFHSLTQSKTIKISVLFIFGNGSMTVFLYQGFAFLLCTTITEKLLPSSNTFTPFLKPVICFSLVILFCMCFLKIFGRFESIHFSLNKTALNHLNNLMNSDKFLIIRYIIFGIATTAINTITYHILYSYIGVSNMVSTILAWFLAVLFAFVTNRQFVFQKQCCNSSLWYEFSTFFSCRLVTGILDIIIMCVAVDYMQWNSLLWKIISNIIVTITNYITSKYLVFKSSNKR